MGGVSRQVLKTLHVAFVKAAQGMRWGWMRCSGRMVNHRCHMTNNCDCRLSWSNDLSIDPPQMPYQSIRQDLIALLDDTALAVAQAYAQADHSMSSDSDSWATTDLNSGSDSDVQPICIIPPSPFPHYPWCQSHLILLQISPLMMRLMSWNMLLSYSELSLTYSKLDWVWPSFSEHYHISQVLWLGLVKPELIASPPSI